MKKYVVLFAFVFEVVNLHSQSISNLYLSNCFSSISVNSIEVNIGVRSFYSRKNSDTFITGGYLIAKDISLNAEVSFQGPILKTNNMKVLLTGKYKLDDNFSAGPFINVETGRYGLFGAYPSPVEFYNILCDVRGGLDFSMKDMFVSFAASKNLSDNFALHSELTYSEGDIQSPLIRYICLFSGGVSYKVNDLFIICAAAGRNFSRDMDNFLSVSVQYGLL